MTDPQTTEVAVDAVTGLVNMFKNAAGIYWLITIYSLLVGAAMTFVGRKHLKKLLFFVGAFTLFLPICSFSMQWALIAGIVAGLVMIFVYPIFVFIMGMVPIAAICVACGVQHPGTFLSLLAFACGIAALIYRKHIVIPVTALSGGIMLAVGFAFLFGGIHPYLFMALFVLFVAGGIFVQYKYTAKGLKDEPKAEPAKK